VQYKNQTLNIKNILLSQKFSESLCITNFKSKFTKGLSSREIFEVFLFHDIVNIILTPVIYQNLQAKFAFANVG